MSGLRESLEAMAEGRERDAALDVGLNGGETETSRRFLREASDLREAAAALPEWRPIAEAPQDGTEIDLWCKAIDCEFRATDAIWNSQMGTWQVDDYPLHEAFGNVGVHATHWMPLPAAPAQQGVEGE